MNFYDDEEIYASLWRFLINRLGPRSAKIRTYSRWACLLILSTFSLFLGIDEERLPEKRKYEEKCIHDSGDKNDNESDQSKPNDGKDCFYYNP